MQPVTSHLTPDGANEKQRALTLSDALDDAARACETKCVDDLDAILGELARLRGQTGGPVLVSKRFDAVWASPAECAK